MIQSDRPQQNLSLRAPAVEVSPLYAWHHDRIQHCMRTVTAVLRQKPSTLGPQGSTLDPKGPTFPTRYSAK